MTSGVDTHLLLRAFCDELARCGLTDACTSPGSRSAPLVLALVREERIHCWSHIDERCAGFFALGLAKATGRPAAISCTSGTAAANLAPAVHEAREARVPLIVLTADRPPELREIGAGQTIDQVKLYGSAAKWFFEVGTHEATEDRLRWMRQLACRAYATSLDGRPGVVHLNFPLREPLVLDEALPADESGRIDGRPWVSVRPAGETLDVAPLLAALSGAERGLVVAGRSDDPSLGRAAAQLAAARGWPILADPLSGGRTGPTAVAHYDALLRDDGFAGAQEPDVVLRVGDLPTSKPLRQWLSSRSAARQIALDSESAWQDPDSSVSEILSRYSASSLGAAATAAGAADSSDWLEAWLNADQAAASAITRTLDDELTEPRVAAELGRTLPSGAALWVASSMPVRDIETFWPARDDPPRVLSNRGANGIDGTVSSAFGAAAAGQGSVVLLIGDVALAHDIGGLLAASRLGLTITIVLLDNGGGGIFNFLPVARQTDAFETHVATPHGLAPERTAALYGLEHRVAGDLDGLRRAVQDSLESESTHLIEVRSDREANVALHRRVWEAVTARGPGAAPPA